MLGEKRDFIASKRRSEPLHVVFHKHLHGRAVDRTGTLDRHAGATGNRHVRTEKNRMSRRIGDWANRRGRRFTVSSFRRFFFLHYWLFKTAGRQSGFFKLPVPAYSKSLYTGVRSTPGPFMFNRTLKSSLSSRKSISP